MHFRELHFLPRVIFSVGAVFLIGAFFVRLFILGLFGVAVIFVGCTLNLGITWWQNLDISFERGTFRIAGMLLWQALLSLAIAICLLSLTYHFYRYGELPPYLQPLPRPH